MEVKNVHRIEPREEIVSLALHGHGLAARPEGIAAEVETDEGARLLVSRFEGESDWTVDGYFAPGSSFPAFWNGEGSRCTLLRKVGPEVAAVLDRRTDISAENRNLSQAWS